MLKIVRLFAVFIFLQNFCVTSLSGQNKPDSKYVGPYDTVLFHDEKLEDLQDLDSRITKLKENNFQIYFYDANWKPVPVEKATFINAIKTLGKDTLLVKDYFISGERQSSAIHVLNISNPDLSQLYLLSSYKDVRKVGKSIYWKKYGPIDYISFWEWSNWEKGHHSSGRIDTKGFQKWSKKLKIVNKSNLKVEELYDQIVVFDKKTKTINSVELELQRNIEAVFSPQLLFLFDNKAMSVDKSSVQIINSKASYKGRSLALCNSVYNLRYRTYCSLGEIILQTTGSYCEDADLNCFVLNQSNENGIVIEGLMNTELFAADTDGDGQDEIYIFSTRSCDNAIKLIRVSQ